MIASAALSIYLRAGQLYVVPLDRTVSGFYTESSTVLTVAGDRMKLGEALLACLSVSRVDVPDPDRHANVTAGLLKAAACRSYSAFVAGTRLVQVFAENGSYRVVATRNEGARRGFAHLEQVAKALADDLLEQVLDAFHRAS